MTPAELYAQLRHAGQVTLPFAMDPDDQQATARAVRRLATRDGLRLSQYRPPRDGAPGPLIYRRHQVMHLALVADDGRTIVRPDA